MVSKVDFIGVDGNVKRPIRNAAKARDQILTLLLRRSVKKELARLGYLGEAGGRR